MPWFNCAVSKNHYSTFMCQIVNSYPIGPISWPQRSIYRFVLHRNQNAIHWPIIGMNHFNKKKARTEILNFYVCWLRMRWFKGGGRLRACEPVPSWRVDIRLFKHRLFFSNFLVLKFQPSNFKTSSYDQYAFIITERQWRLWCVSRNCEHSWLRCKTPLLTPLHLVCATRYLSQQ